MVALRRQVARDLLQSEDICGRARSPTIPRMRSPLLLVRTLVLSMLPAISLIAQADHRNYEVGQTRPIAVSNDGARLYALNTPDDRLVVYTLADASRPRIIHEVRVGLRPVAIRERNAGELWIANRLGDSISVVAPETGEVTATFEVGDEPCDIAFAKQGARELAFVTLALEDRVLVLDADTHAVLKSVPIFGKEPVRLVTSADGKSVYVAVQKSGNKTTILSEKEPTRPAAPKVGAHLPAAPRTGVIVDSDDPKWKSKLGGTLPDNDVIEIDVATLQITRRFRGVGTVLFGMAVDASGDLWVANTEARNRVRFEPNLRGHIVDNRITRIVTSSTPTVTPIDLNPGIDYTKLPNPPALASSIAQPVDVVVGKGQIWVAGFGSDRIGVLDSAGKVVARIDVGENSGATTAPRKMRGPRGLALHPNTARLYVLNRLWSGIAVIDTQARKQIAEFSFRHDPESAQVRAGRGFLYDAKLSGNGTASCASCHIDGGVDQLAWDLGDPDGQLFRISTDRGLYDLHPAKGPLSTQTLKGLKGEQPFHWRADKKAFTDFNAAFDGLMGRTQISSADMAAYSSFIDTVEHMPNPNQLRDRSFSKEPAGLSAEDGRQFYMSVFALGPFRCVDCHALPTGSDKRIFHPLTLDTLQPAKVAPLRTVYRRLGRRVVGGERKSGFGLLHEGSEDDVFALLSRRVFGSISRDANTKTKLQRFVESFDTGTAPAVGHTVFVDKSNAVATRVTDYLTLMIAQHAVRNADLTAHGTVDGQRVQLLWNSSAGRFDTNRTGLAFTRAALVDKLKLGAGRMTFVGVPPGSGRRFALDRDRDGKLDGDEAAVTYGSPSPPCATTTLRANSAAEVGNTEFGVVVDGTVPNAGVLLALAAQKGQGRILGVDLHVDLTTSIILSLPSDARGNAMIPLPIANDPGLAGTRLFAQAYGLSKCATLGLEASNGLEIFVRN